MTETEISKQCLDALRLAFPPPGAWFHRNNVGGRHGRFQSVGLGNGSPDLVGCVDGAWIGIEIKRPGKWPEIDQREWQVRHELAGGVYVVAHCPQEAIDGVREAMCKREMVA